MELFYNSFVFAAGSVLLALPVAVLFAWLIERTNTPLRTVAYALVIAPVAMAPTARNAARNFFFHPA